MTKSAADYILGVWNAPEIPLRVEFPLEIMEQLRSLVCDDLQRLSRGGTDPAGLLFGISGSSAARILAWRPISRSAGEGQETDSTPHDRAELVRVLSGAASDPGMRGLEPLGWFVSRAQTGAGLTAPEVELYNNFFPNPWQFTLLVRRGPGGTARAGFFARDGRGMLRTDASYRELLIQPVRRVPGTAERGASPPAVPGVEEISRPFVEASREATSVSEAAERPHESVAAMPAEAVQATPVEPPQAISVQPAAVISTEPAAKTAAEPEAAMPAVPMATASVVTPREPALAELASTAPAPAAATPSLPTPGALSPVASAAPAPSPAMPAPSAEGNPPSTEAAELATPSGLKPASHDVPHEPATVTVPPDVSRTVKLGEAPSPPAPAKTSAPAPLPVRTRIFTIPADTKTSESLEKTPEEETPSFLLQAHSFGGARWLWVLPVLLALAVVIFLLLQKTAATTVQSFSLQVDDDKNQVDISWDRNSIPAQNGQRAEIQILDGGNRKQLSVSADELHRGVVSYTRQSGDVAVQMIIYAGGQQYHEFARLVALASAADALPASESPETGRLRAERDDLKSQVQQLTEQVRKEAARADQAESVVRILENRLKIDGAREPQAGKK